MKIVARIAVLLLMIACLPGFGLLFNWNRLGAGSHSLRAFADGVEFARASFTITTLGVEFPTGASGSVTLENFPAPDAA